MVESKRSHVSLGQPTVKARYLESPAPRGGAEGTKERVLALHTENLAKEIDESASLVVVFRQGVKSNSLMPLTMGTVCPQVMADYMERSMRFFPTYKVSIASAQTMAVMVKLARETDESASDVVVFGMVR